MAQFYMLDLKSLLSSSLISAYDIWNSENGNIDKEDMRKWCIKLKDKMNIFNLSITQCSEKQLQRLAVIVWHHLV